MTETYQYGIVCDNCLNLEYVEINYGYTVKEFRRTYQCKKCGCK